MVNTNNTKFTFNKKGFALSLACVGLLATAGNAVDGIAGTNVKGSNGAYYVTGDLNTKANDTITVTGENTLGFSGSGNIAISGGVSFITGTGGGNLEELNLFHVDSSKTLTLLKDALNINVDTTTMNIGSGAKSFTISGGGSLKFGKNTFNEVNLNNVTFSSGGGTITNAGTITDMVINEFVNSAKKTQTIAFKNDGAITTLTNNANITGSGAGVNVSGSITLDLGKVGTFIQNGTLKNITINSGTIGTFTNTANIDNSTIKVNVNDFNNSGSITTAASSDIKVSNSFNNVSGADFKLAGTITLQGAADAKDAKTTFDNAGLFSGGTINIVKNVLTFNNAATGTINKSTISGTGTILTFTNAGTITGSTLGKNLTIGTLDNSGVITELDTKTDAYIKDVFKNSGTVSGSTIIVGKNTTPATTFTNAASGVINNSTMTVNVNGFENAGKIIAHTGSTITVNKTFSNTGTLSGGTIALKGAGSVRNATFAGTNSGTIQASTISFSGFHKSFENSGIISGGNISGANSSAEILTFTNTADGAIKSSKIEIGIADFNNAGTITTGNNSTIKIYNSFNNAKNASFILNGTLTLEGDARDSKTTFDNAGTFSGGTINIEANNNVLTFNNTGEIKNSTISNAGTIQTFKNTGEIKNSTINGTGTILSLNNDGVMSVKAVNANVAKFQNTKEFTLSGGGTLKVLDSFNNVEKAILEATDTGTKLILGNPKKANANTTETTFVNAGTIDGKGKLEISQSGGWVKSFTNTGLIDKTTITSGGANGIVTFANSGTIDNSTLQVNVVNFNNLEGGLIDFRGAANSSINLSGALDKTASFNNAGTIDNLASAISVDTNVTNVSFKNSGSIYQGATVNTAVLNLKGASNILDFNNSGTIALAGTNTSAAITAVEGAKANIINTGAITLGNTNSAHMDLTNIQAAKDAPFVVKEWHLSNIGSADAYNGNYKSDGRDKIVVKGFARDITAGTSKLRFDKGSIVIDPIKNTGMVSGQPYLLDRIVVNETGAPVEEIHKDDGTKGTSYDNLIAAAYELNKDTNTYTLKAGVEDPRLVTFDTIRSSDPIFEIYGVDAYGAELKDGKLTNKLGKVGEVADENASTKYVEDGIIDSFQVGVNPSKGAGAAAVQSAVNNSITRNAFVGNVINTAVNSALASLNNFNRVSYNDEEVDFEKLEKYAAVSSDVADQTYAKDSNVYVMPYYRSTSVDLAGGSSLDADTYGIVLGGNKNLGNAGVIGLFLGYENADGSANNLDTEDDTFFGGINYYKTLGGTSTYDYFVKGMLRLANTSSDLTRKGQTYETSSADTFSYGLEANVGMNFYNGIHTITPEVGLSYDRVEVDGFKLNGVDYNDNNINLVVGKIGLNWLAQFTESVSTNVGFGIRYNFNDDFDTSLRISNGAVYSTNTDLGDFYYYLNLGVNVALTQNWELGVMYNGDFSSDASSHSGFVKLGYWW